MSTKLILTVATALVAAVLNTAVAQADPTPVTTTPVAPPTCAKGLHPVLTFDGTVKCTRLFN